MVLINGDLAAKATIFFLIDGEGQHVRFQLIRFAASVPPFVGDIDMAGRTSRQATAIAIDAFKFIANGRGHQAFTNCHINDRFPAISGDKLDIWQWLDLEFALMNGGKLISFAGKVE